MSPSMRWPASRPSTTCRARPSPRPTAGSSAFSGGRTRWRPPPKRGAGGRRDDGGRGNPAGNCLLQVRDHRGVLRLLRGGGVPGGDLLPVPADRSGPGARATTPSRRLVFRGRIVRRGIRGEGQMTGVRLLVGTRKGAFVLTSDGSRQNWDINGPLFAGW